MSQRARRLMLLAGGAALFVLVVIGVAGLPPYGHYPGPYGDVLNTVAPHERQIPNVVTAINFDYRGLDTLGEEYILFAAVAGITLVLRRDRPRTTDRALPPDRALHGSGMTDAIRFFALLGLALTIAFGLYMAIHTAQTPGGGFQGGAILGGAAAIIFLGLGYRTFARVLPQKVLEPAESLGAGGYVLVGLVTLAISGFFLKNTLPLGGEGLLFANGTIPIINLCVLLEVCTGFALLFLEFAHETRVEDPEPK